MINQHPLKRPQATPRTTSSAWPSSASRSTRSIEGLRAARASRASSRRASCSSKVLTRDARRSPAPPADENPLYTNFDAQDRHDREARRRAGASSCWPRLAPEIEQHGLPGLPAADRLLRRSSSRDGHRRRRRVEAAGRRRLLRLVPAAATPPPTCRPTRSTRSGCARWTRIQARDDGDPRGAGLSDHGPGRGHEPRCSDGAALPLLRPTTRAAPGSSRTTRRSSTTRTSAVGGAVRRAAQGRASRWSACRRSRRRPRPAPTTTPPSIDGARPGHVLREPARSRARR